MCLAICQTFWGKYSKETISSNHFDGFDLLTDYISQNTTRKQCDSVLVWTSVVLPSDHFTTETQEKPLRNVSCAGKTAVGSTHSVILHGVCPVASIIKLIWRMWARSRLLDKTHTESHQPLLWSQYVIRACFWVKQVIPKDVRILTTWSSFRTSTKLNNKKEKS